MSKLVEILEIYDEIEFNYNCIQFCDKAMEDASKALKKDPDSSELKAIYESARTDKDRISGKLKGLEEKFNTLFEQVKADPEFVQEIEKTTIVPERLKKAFSALKAELTSPKAAEKTGE